LFKQSQLKNWVFIASGMTHIPVNQILHFNSAYLA